jgi:uncharacterized small protein (DUF1192 family)
MDAAQPPPNTEVHGPTALVCDVLVQLLAHGGWMRVTELAERVGAHRDNVRRVLGELTRREWTRRKPGEDGADRYALGPELPAIGTAYLQLLQAEQARIRADFDRVTLPFNWHDGPFGPEFRSDDKDSR